MKLFYLTVLDELDREKCGILGKIRGQIKAFKCSGIEVHFGHFCGKNNFKIESNYKENFIKCKGKNTRARLGSVYKKLYSYICDNGIETVYIRFTSLDGKAIAFYKKLKNINVKVIIEFYSHNLELEAKKTVKRNWMNHKYSLAIKGYISLKINRHYFSKLKECINLIVTTTKVGDMYGVPTINVVNGIDTTSSKVRVKEKNNYDFNIVSVAMISPWHGYDRVIKGIADYYKNGGVKNILYTVVGDGEEKKNLEKLVSDLKLEEHVVFTGIKLNEELTEYYNKADIALEMLAGFRRTKGQISSIKMAEYFAKGIPILYAADSKIYDDEMEKYCYWEENNDKPVNIEAIMMFCDNLYKENNDISYRMHKIAEERFDWTYTMKELIDFILEKK